MASLIKFTGDGGSLMELDHEDFQEQVAYLHANDVAMDYTLCGDTLDGDPETMGSFENVEAKYVTCPRCIEIIKLCKSLKTKG